MVLYEEGGINAGPAEINIIAKMHTTTANAATHQVLLLLLLHTRLLSGVISLQSIFHPGAGKWFLKRKSKHAGILTSQG